MDYIFIWLQAKLGPITFGAAAGFILQVILFRPKNWAMAAERAAAAVIMSMAFYRPLANILVSTFEMDRDTAIGLASTLLALGGIELLRAVRARLIKTVEDKDNG